MPGMARLPVGPGVGLDVNLAIMEREARSQRELQALQVANNKAAKHQESILVKLRGRAPRPRSAF